LGEKEEIKNGQFQIVSAIFDNAYVMADFEYVRAHFHIFLDPLILYME